MSTSAQVAANQANAQHSTGPKSETGKATASQNNFRHGLSGAFRVTEYEDREEYDTLHLELAREHAPQTLTEEMLVETMAQSYWLRCRAVRLQRICMEPAAADNPENDKQLALFIRYQTTHDRAFHAALNALLKLRAEKRKAEIGFESQQRKRGEEAQRQAAEIRRVAAENRKQELHQWAVQLAEAKVDRQQALNKHGDTPKITPGAKSEARQSAQQAA